MSAPKCRLCGHAHWTNEDHVFPDTPSRVTKKALASEAVDKAPRAKAERSEQPVANVANSESERVQKWRAKNRDRYNARERERMRASRAARRVPA
jgi:hypothetical protein